MLLDEKNANKKEDRYLENKVEKQDNNTIDIGW